MVIPIIALRRSNLAPPAPGLENRRYPRFQVEEPVTLKIWGLDFQQDHQTMETPFPVGTRVVSSFPNVKSAPEITGEVVYSRAHQPDGQEKPKGVGIQYTDLTDQRRQALDQMMSALLSARGIMEGSAAQTEDPADAHWQRFLAFKRHADERRYYAALCIDASAETGTILGALNDATELLQNPPPETPAPRKTRLSAARPQLEGIRGTLLHPQHRLEYDVMHAHRDGKQALAAIEQHYLNAESVRRVWRAANPDLAREADRLADEAQTALRGRNLQKAVQLATQSLEKDPFNERIRMALPTWRKQAGL
jgi:hypothetical protein